MARKPRGIENNNPGNIRLSKEKWQGLSAMQDDPSFFQFKAPEWGIRAIARLLITYQDKYSINTLEGIIKRWAPAAGKDPKTGRYYKNPTDKYIDFISEKTGLDKGKFIDVHNYDDIFPIVVGIIAFENGVSIGYYSKETVSKGLALAGVMPPKKSVVKSKTAASGAAASASGIGLIALEQISVAQEAISPIAAYIEPAKYVLLGLIVLGGALTIYFRMRDNDKRIA